MFLLIIKRTSLLFSVLLISHISIAQHIFKGRILDSISKQPLEGACIKAYGKMFTTNKEGFFQFKSVKDTIGLRISYLGYKPRMLFLKSDRKYLEIGLSRGELDLNEIIISPSLNVNSFHTLSNLDLHLRPINTSQDLMRLVPGLFIAQHMGGGKAEQIFIRGFDADHGTDINVTVDGMPVNMVSHVHGQGYADLHFLIPETVSTFDYGKGPYYSEKGDFTTAGYLDFQTKDVLEKNIFSLEGGNFNTVRGLIMLNVLDAHHRNMGENWYIASEFNYTDGPFTWGERYKRFNAFSKFSTRLNKSNRLSISASAFTTQWRASGEIPERAVNRGSISLDSNGRVVTLPLYQKPIQRFGTIDSSQGGKTSRYNLIGKVKTDLGNNLGMENELYYSYYDFLLHVNSTFYADTAGGERQQEERRNVYGYLGKISKRVYWAGSSLNSSLGLNTRFDNTYHVNYSFVNSQYQLVQEIAQGNTQENNTGIFLDESLEIGKWILNLGSRLDFFGFHYHDSTKANWIISPKINLQFTPNNRTQFYLKLGKGFHSNKAVTVIRNNGFETLPAAYGGDLGMNWKPSAHLWINTAIWYLFLQQEFVYSDDGNIVPGGRTRRYGLDLSARYQVFPWLFADFNLNLAHPRLADSSKSTGYLALAPTFTSTGGLDFKLKNGINGGLSYRYLHRRPGNNTGLLSADGYFVTDLKLNYSQKRYEIGISIENLLNTKWNEFEAEEISRLKGETSPIDQMSFTPGTSIAGKLRIALFF